MKVSKEEKKILREYHAKMKEMCGKNASCKSCEWFDKIDGSDYAGCPERVFVHMILERERKQ